MRLFVQNERPFQNFMKIRDINATNLVFCLFSFGKKGVLRIGTKVQGSRSSIGTRSFSVCDMYYFSAALFPHVRHTSHHFHHNYHTPRHIHTLVVLYFSTVFLFLYQRHIQTALCPMSPPRTRKELLLPDPPAYLDGHETLLLTPYVNCPQVC